MTIGMLAGLGYFHLTVYLIDKMIKKGYVNFSEPLSEMFIWSDDAMGLMFWIGVVEGSELNKKDMLIAHVMGGLGW